MSAGAILEDGRAAVVTGQQAGLFGGPLYTLYKLLGAISVASTRDARVVFWVECDDADVRRRCHRAHCSVSLSQWRLECPNDTCKT